MALSGLSELHFDPTKTDADGSRQTKNRYYVNPIVFILFRARSGPSFPSWICRARNLGFACYKHSLLDQRSLITASEPHTTNACLARTTDSNSGHSMCQYQEQLWRCGCTHTMTKLPCHDLLQTSGKQCSGNRYRTDWIPDLCPGCEQVGAKKLAEGKRVQCAVAVESAAAVQELLKQSEKKQKARKSDAFLDLYR